MTTIRPATSDDMARSRDSRLARFESHHVKTARAIDKILAESSVRKITLVRNPSDPVSLATTVREVRRRFRLLGWDVSQSSSPEHPGQVVLKFQSNGKVVKRATVPAAEVAARHEASLPAPKRPAKKASTKAPSPMKGIVASIRAGVLGLAGEFNLTQARAACVAVDARAAELDSNNFGSYVRNLVHTGDIVIVQKGRPRHSPIYRVRGSRGQVQEEPPAPAPAAPRVPVVGKSVEWVGDDVEDKACGPITSILSSEASGHFVRVRTPKGTVRPCPLPAGDSRWRIV